LRVPSAILVTDLRGTAVRTVAVVNRKGGSGKTTTAVNTAAALAEAGRPVLLLDLDPQGSASEWLDRAGDDRGLSEAYLGRTDLARLAVRTETPSLDIVPAAPWLITAERTLLGELSLGVARAIQGLPERWAFVIVDCPPSLSYLSIGVLMGVRELVIPVEAHGMAVTGADAVIDELAAVRQLNPGLGAAHLLPCRVNRTKHARDVIATLEADYAEIVTRSRIRDTIKLAEAHDARQPITTFAPSSAGAADYRAFAAELMARGTPGDTREGAGGQGWWSRWRPDTVTARR
jgi:chromosome partitioning protein